MVCLHWGSSCSWGSGRSRRGPLLVPAKNKEAARKRFRVGFKLSKSDCSKIDPPAVVRQSHIRKKAAAGAWVESSLPTSMVDERGTGDCDGGLVFRLLAARNGDGVLQLQGSLSQHRAPAIESPLVRARPCPTPDVFASIGNTRSKT